MANKITVTSLGTTANVNATPDSARYYSDKSKEWAISDKLIDNEDYSSKYYANESKKQADISTAKAVEVVESGNTAVSNIESARDNAIINVNTAGATQVALATEQATIATNKASEVVTSGNEALANIDTAKNNAITSITNQETTSKNNIINEGATQVANVNSAGNTQINLAKEQVTIATNQATIATNKASEVVTSGNTALSNIATAKNNAITSITNQETTSKNNIINEGTTQVGLIQQEGIARVEEILETGCIDVDYTEETSTLIFTGGGNALLSNYYTKEETDSLIPTNNNQLINGAGYITDAYHDNTKQDVITDLVTIRSGASKGATALQSYTETDPVYTADKPKIALKSEIPTKVSSFANDANYQTYTDVASMIASIPQFSLSIVDSLPSSGQKMVLYLVPKTSAGGDDIYDEYIWIESTSSFELVGSTTVDLSDYYSKTETNELLDDCVHKTGAETVEGDKTFIAPQGMVIERTTVSGPILKLVSSYYSTNFVLERTNGAKCVLESGDALGLFGTQTNHPLQIRTGYKNRITIGTDGSVILATDVASGSNDNQVATTKWVNNKLSNTETWTFTLEDGTEVTKTMVLGA